MASLLLSAAALTSSAAAQNTSTKATALAGVYDGSQMEMGVALRLQPNGRFDYMLAYGALDESASGTWSVEGGDVLLTSDPVTAPKFVLIDQRLATDGKLHLVLDLPKGWTRQYFDAAVGLADGRYVGGQLSDDEDVIRLAPGDRPVSLRLQLGVYEARSDSFRLDGTAASIVHVRFEPNDLGKVAFAGTTLHIVGKTLTFERYGRSITFKPTDQKWETE
ncbi:MAG: hypothetical protein ACTHJR_08980 [Sphingomonas sp.]|uniref:hypothetical protein n=1 Tax=Sphingomonas sp. TaxID=28214 RepID=UPI003F7D3835